MCMLLGVYPRFWQGAISALNLYLNSFELTLKNNIVSLSFKKYYLFFSIFGCAGSSWLRGFSLVAVSRGATLPCGVRASQCGGFSYCRA